MSVWWEDSGFFVELPRSKRKVRLQVVRKLKKKIEGRYDKLDRGGKAWKRRVRIHLKPNKLEIEE